MSFKVVFFDSGAVAVYISFPPIYCLIRSDWCELSIHRMIDFSACIDSRFVPSVFSEQKRSGFYTKNQYS